MRRDLTLLSRSMRGGTYTRGAGAPRRGASRRRPVPHYEVGSGRGSGRRCPRRGARVSCACRVTRPSRHYHARAWSIHWRTRLKGSRLTDIYLVRSPPAGPPHARQRTLDSPSPCHVAPAAHPFTCHMYDSHNHTDPMSSLPSRAALVPSAGTLSSFIPQLSLDEPCTSRKHHVQVNLSRAHVASASILRIMPL